MGKILVVAEKPSVGRDYAAFLGCKDRKDGYIEGPKYIVSWTIGHLISLKEPEEYDVELKKWNMEKLPIIPEKFQIKVTQDGKKQFSVLKELINRPDVDYIINGGDAGREGELIQRYCYIMAGNKKPVKRLWVSSITTKALQEGFNNLKDSSMFDSLFQSALARSQADWLYGMNYTRAITLRFGDGKHVLSIGRCQTPILRLIVDRDKLIDDFKPEAYYELKANFGDYTGKLVTKEPVLNRAIIENIKAKIDGKNGTIIDISTKNNSNVAPQLYNLTDLSKRMNEKYGFTANETLAILQSLYETHHIATYPRASAKVLDHTMFEVVKNNIGKLAFGGFEKFIPKLNIVESKRYVDETKIEDHHAIIPDFKNDNIAEEYAKLNANEKKVFDELIKSVIAAFMPNYEYNSTNITTVVENELFESKAKEIVNLGWKELFLDDKKEKSEEAEDLVTVKLYKGDNRMVQQSEILDKKTKPKPRYTESTLLSEMVKYNIGTEATRAGLIETLKRRQYIEVNKKSLISTDLGKKLIEAIPLEKIKSPANTEEFEKLLENINQNKISRLQFLNMINEELSNDINKIKGMEKKTIGNQEKKTIGTCPLCNKGNIVAYPSGYGCTEYHNGCRFFIGTICKKKLTEKQVQQLITNRTTGEINGFTSKKGTKFSAKLILDDNNNIKFIFPERK